MTTTVMDVAGKGFFLSLFISEGGRAEGSLVLYHDGAKYVAERIIHRLVEVHSAEENYGYFEGRLRVPPELAQREVDRLIEEIYRSAALN